MHIYLGSNVVGLVAAVVAVAASGVVHHDVIDGHYAAAAQRLQVQALQLRERGKEGGGIGLSVTFLFQGCHINSGFRVSRIL